MRIADSSRIIAVRAMGSAKVKSANPLNRAHRQKYLLSGLMKCGACGGGYSVIAKDRYGCAARRSKGTCSNGTSIGREELEERVLTSLQTRLMAPEYVAAFIEEFTAEVNRSAREEEAKRGAWEREANGLQRKITTIIEAIEGGTYSRSMKERLTVLERRKAEIEDRLKETPPAPMRIHPNVHMIYERKVADLVSTLNSADIRTEASEILLRVTVANISGRLARDIAKNGRLCRVDPHRSRTT